MSLCELSAYEIAAAVRSGRTSATQVARSALERAEADRFNCYTKVTRERALETAQKTDAAIAQGRDAGPLAGVPYAVKNLFDVRGVTTWAGSKINRDDPPAGTDATLIRRLDAAGATLIGALNMDEYAYGFTTENTHYGATRNPHDPSRSAGGSSGGSAAAVAARMIPLSLGSDTNGSIRVPASLCGVFGLKPTYSRLSRAGAFLFSYSLDHMGIFARKTADIAVSYDSIMGPDNADPSCDREQPPRPLSNELGGDIGELRIAVAGGYFDDWAQDPARNAVRQVADALNAHTTIDLPQAERARAAAYLITASEGGNLHLDRLRRRAADFDPMTRDRFIAGAALPATWYLQAQRFRSWFRERMRAIFNDVDVIIAPATPCYAPELGQDTINLNGQCLPLRPSLGLLTQPISFIGLPVITIPVHSDAALPIGVQLIAAAWREDVIIRVAAWLENNGVARAHGYVG